MLSGEQILKYLGNRIIIHPFEPRHLRGATYNLTVGGFVWLHPKTQKQREAGNMPPMKPKRQGSGFVYEVPGNGLVTILTKEVLVVDNTLAGQFHSKVDMVTKGFSHISTTLDPDWKGPLLITMKNHTEFSVKLWEGETFIKVTFHRLSKATLYRHNNDPGRGKLLIQQGFAFPNEQEDFLDTPINSNLEAIKTAFEESDAWKTIVANRKNRVSKKIRWAILLLSGIAFLVSATSYIWIPRVFSTTLEGAELVTILAAVLPTFYLFIESLKNHPWD